MSNDLVTKLQDKKTRIETLTIRSRLDVFNALEFRTQLQSMFDQMITHLVVDLSQAAFVDSTGMAVLISALKQCRQNGGNVRLVMPHSEAVKRILELVRFDRVYDMNSSVEEAVAAFQVG